MMLTLRQGPPPAERPMEPATAADVEVLARRHGLQTVRSERVPDVFGRDGIAWEVIWLRLPDDSTGARPQNRPAIQRRRCPGPDPRAARRREVHSAHARHVHHVSGQFRPDLSMRAKAGANPGFRSRGRGVPLVVRHVFRSRQPVAGDEPLRRVDRARGAQRVDRDDARLRPAARFAGYPHGGAAVAGARA